MMLSIAVRVGRRVQGQQGPVKVWMGLRGFGHDRCRSGGFRAAPEQLLPTATVP